MNDDELHDLIRQSQPKPEFPVSFQREVWARIAIAEQQSWSAQWQRWCQSLIQWVAQPSAAVAMVATMLIAGAGLGHLSGSRDGTASLQSAYLSSINPVAAAHATRQP
jgi:hypothetical protein